MHRGRGAACAAAGAVVVALLAGASPAAALSYASPTSHYTFAYPDTWAASANASGDAAFLGPADGGFRPNVVAQHEAEPTARNASDWLLSYAQNSLNAVKAQLGVTEVQAPRTFETGSGRLAADYAFERPVGNLTVHQRQVFWVSEFHKLAFFVTLTDKNTTFASHGDDWNLIVFTFEVTGEGDAGWQGLLLPGALLAAAAVAAGAGVVLVRRRGRAARSAASAPLLSPPEAAPAGPPRGPAPTARPPASRPPPP